MSGAAMYLPDGYEVEYRKSLSGCTYYHVGLIQAPRPVTRKSLHVFLHECAHVHLGHCGSKRKKHVRHVEEMEAEQWATTKMREHGIIVPRKMIIKSRAYVADAILQAARSGAKRIDAKTMRYVGNNTSPSAVAWKMCVKARVARNKR